MGHDIEKRPGPRSAARALARTACAVLLVVLLPASIPKDQLECEEAVGHLQGCCPLLEAPRVCGDGCSPITLSEEQSRCIRDRDCEAIAAAHICERVAALSASADSDDAGPQQVCP